MKLQTSNTNYNETRIGVWFKGLLPFVVSLVALTSQLTAQTFDSGSDEANGALNFTLANADAEGIILFDPQALGLVSDQNNAYHFTTINVEAGVTVKMRADISGTNPIIWLASGDVIIDGTLDLNGENGHDNDQLALAAVAGPSGFSGGTGRTELAPAFPGAGPGGGNTTDNPGGGGGGAGHQNNGSGAFSFSGPGGSAGESYGNLFLVPLLGGSGGAGGGESSSGAGVGNSGNVGSGGGAGGGAILIASSTQIQIDGAILCKGGRGGNTSSRGGGGGSGGSIRLMANTLSGLGSLSADRGLANFSVNISSGRGGDGSVGRIRLEAFDHQFSGTVSPNTQPRVSPGIVFPSQFSLPSLRVVRLSGLSVPPNAFVSVDLPMSPTASFNPTDVTIEEDAEVTFEIEASNIPLGTVVNLTLTNETDGFVSFSSTPLAGTEENSTATATVTIPHGFSRFTIEADWDTGM